MEQSENSKHVRPYVSLRMTPQLKKRLALLAKRQRRTLTAVVEIVIEHGLRAVEKEARE